MRNRHLITLPPDATPHPTHDGYRASPDGRIFSTIRCRKRGIVYRCADGTGYELKGKIHTDGHLILALSGKRKRFAHILVLETFVGPCPEGMQCRHLDGNPRNNRVDNLRWGTPLENWEDAVRHGTQWMLPGDDSPIRKLSDADAVAVRAAAARGIPQREIARDYGVQQSTVSRIVNRVRRKRVGP